MAADYIWRSLRSNRVFSSAVLFDDHGLLWLEVVDAGDDPLLKSGDIVCWGDVEEFPPSYFVEEAI